jgi:hypothetical protein
MQRRYCYPCIRFFKLAIVSSPLMAVLSESEMGERITSSSHSLRTLEGPVLTKLRYLTVT